MGLVSRDYLTIRQLVSALSATLRETLPRIVPFSLPLGKAEDTACGITGSDSGFNFPGARLFRFFPGNSQDGFSDFAHNFLARIVKGFNLMEFQFRNFIDFEGYLHIANNVNN
jgi:hypothetical protein